MGLASALSTALTGLQAAETVIDVAGNNLANSNTVGFKASEAVFATQFLQTRSLGSAPTANAGGSNPTQIGLGTQVAEISPDFTQGTIEVSSNPSDLAIQGDGFFIVQSSGEQLYTRNGIFKLNSNNQLVTVTGNQLLGYGVDNNFKVRTTEVVPLDIPLGATQVAQATQNVFLEGTLIPEGDVAVQAEVIQSAVLGDALIERPATAVAVSTAPLVATTGITATSTATGGGAALTPGDTYAYRFTFVDKAGNETLPSTNTVPASPALATVGGGHDSITLASLPIDPSSGEKYETVRIYRTVAGGAGDFFLVGDADVSSGPTSFVDGLADGSISGGATIPAAPATLTGNYSYYITYAKAGGVDETRPSPLSSPVNVIGSRIHISGLPTPVDSDFTEIHIYRNLSTNSATYFEVGEVAVGEDFTDSKSDSTIAAGKALDLNGPKVVANTLLTNIRIGNGDATNLQYEQLFTEGTLSFTGNKGDRDLATKTFTITSTTTAIELVNFMGESLGIQPTTAGGIDPIPPSANEANSAAPLSPGGSITSDGRFQFVGNNGVANAVNVPLSAFTLKPAAGTAATNPQLDFGSAQSAIGESAVTDFIAFDSLGIQIGVRLTMVMEERTGAGVTYRWFADSAGNDPSTGAGIAVGTGLVTFDGEGNVVDVSNSTVSIDRANVPSVTPLEFNLDFSSLSGLDANESSLAASRQDGSSPGTLSSFIIGEDGIIRGVFSNGITRDLGQILLARFANPNGLEQRGENLFAGGVNSGLAIRGAPGSQGIGSIIAGATELSNTDVGQSLIDLILASTQYRSNTRVINSAQQLLDELLNLRR
jgi:flagellar hook protein FlgE